MRRSRLPPPQFRHASQCIVRTLGSDYYIKKWGEAVEFRQLRYFVHVAKLRSFTEASRRLYVAQPALSRQIKALEAELGTELFLRTSRGVELTEAGKNLEEMARFVLEYVSEIPNQLSDSSEQPSGVVSIGLPPSLAYLIAPNLIEATQQRYPLISLRIVESLSVVLREWVEQGRIELAVLTDPGHLLTLNRLELLREDMVLIGSPKLLGDKERFIKLRNVQQYPLMISNGFRSVLEPWLKAHDIQLRFDMLLDSIPIMKEIVQRGKFCSIVPYSMVHNECAQKKLVALTLQEPAIMRRLVLVNAARRPVSNAMKAVQQLVVEQMAGMSTRLSASVEEEASPAPEKPRIRRKQKPLKIRESAQAGARSPAKVH